jgi:ribonuclease HI
MRQFWTDGSAIPNPGKGGWAVIENGEPVALGKAENTTNIRMEATAILNAMKLTDEPSEICTDSEFWINVLTKWAPGWEAKGWKKASKGEIQNLDLVQELFALYKQKQSKLTWVRGHVGTEMNEKADEWANKAREGAEVA